MLDLQSLNQAQREAVMHGGGPLLVLAGPGSGKTYTITQRIFYLLEREKVSPENILVITFTKDAALSMQSRFLTLSHRTLPVNFGTFHSVFYHILRESRFFANHNANQILTEAQKKKLIAPILKKYLSKEDLQYKQNDLSQEAITALAAISFYKNTGDQDAAQKKLPEELQTDFQTLFQEYEQERRKRNAIDFDDMVYECYRTLKSNKDLREYWQERFVHILVDEFQDINPMQYEVLRLLSVAPYNIFAVGDDDQAIYGFRGSKPACLQQFVKDYGAKQVCLNINYRSLPEIIKASLTVIDENKERFSKQLTASDEKKEQEQEILEQKQPAKQDTMEVVKLCGFEEREQQYQYLIAQLRGNSREVSNVSEEKLEEENYENGKSIGVLFRTNAYMQGLATRLSKEGIPYVMKEKTVSIYEHFVVKDILAYIKVASGKGTRAEFLQIMNRPSRYISRDALGLGEGIPGFAEMISFYRRKGLESHNMQVIWSLEKWQQQMKYLAGLSPFLAVQYIRKVIGYEAYLKHSIAKNAEHWQEWEELLNWLSEDAANYGTVREWFEAQAEYGKKLAENKQTQSKGLWEKGQNAGSEKEKQVPKISLMTVHASKGLEFDKVYIPDCNEKIFPHGSMPDEKTCEEERRLFYVAMTRAKESLELLYLTGTKERPRLPSRFLNGLFRDGGTPL